MCERVWALIEKQGIERRDPATCGDDEYLHRGLKTVSKLKELKRGERSPEDYPIVRAALDSVFQQTGRTPAANWGQPLVTFPLSKTSTPWLVPSSIWHFDHYYPVRGVISGINVFLLIDDVAPGGGGTTVVRNSPRLMDRLLNSGVKFTKISEQNRGFLSSHPWLSGLKVPKRAWNEDRNARYMDIDTDLDGIPARVEELTGSAGDVFVCHPALLHAPAMNVSDRPRLMRTQRVRARSHLAPV